MADLCDPLSLSAMLNALPKLRIPTPSEAMREEIQSILQLPNHSCSCGLCDASDPREVEEMRSQWMFIMTSSQQDVAHLFQEFVSSLNLTELKRMASFLTLDSDYFMEIATSEYGSKRLQKFMGFDDADTFFCDAILRSFFHVMTDEHASDVAVRAMRIWDGEEKLAMFEHTCFYALDIACDQHGCLTLNEIITNLDNSYLRDQLVNIVAHKVLWLSTDPIQLNDWLGRHHIAFDNIAAKFRGQCVELSLQKHGSDVVKRLLEAKESVMLVVHELMVCKGDGLLRLVRSEYGNSVVCHALRATYEMRLLDLHYGLVPN